MPQIVVVEGSPETVVLASAEQGPPGPMGPVGEEDVPYSKRIDAAPQGSNDIYYKGEAAVGASEAAAVWRIRKIVVENDDDVTETWAGGSASFDKIWNDRLTYAYS